MGKYCLQLNALKNVEKHDLNTVNSRYFETRYRNGKKIVVLSFILMVIISRKFQVIPRLRKIRNVDIPHNQYLSILCIIFKRKNGVSMLKKSV